MVRDDDAIWMLRQLEQLARKLGVEVRYEPLTEKDELLSPRSGYCKLHGRQLIEHLGESPLLRLLAFGLVYPPDVVILLVGGPFAVSMQQTAFRQRQLDKFRHRVLRPL